MKSDDVKKWFIANEKLYFTSLELTQNCNFNCSHCYCADKHCENMPLEDWKCIIDKLHTTGCLYLNLTGGEIFTHKDFKEIYTYAKNKGFIVDLLTNASLLDVTLIDLFKILPPNSIAITIYGVNENDYLNFTGDGENFNRTINALELLKSNNIHFVLRTVATKTLRDSLLKGEFEALAKRFNTTFKYDTIVFPTTSGDMFPLNECMAVDEVIELERSTEMRKNAWSDEIKERKPFI